MPGSREKEISSLMPEFSKAAEILSKKHPHLHFVCIKAPNMDENFVRSYWQSDVVLEIVSPSNRWEAMRTCELLIVASGTVSLESAIAGVPSIVCYKLSNITYRLGRALVKIPYISLANLILRKEVFPELIQDDCDAKPLAEKVLSWLDPRQKDKIFSSIDTDLENLRSKLGSPGAVERAADCILSDLK